MEPTEPRAILAYWQVKFFLSEPSSFLFTQCGCEKSSGYARHPQIQSLGRAGGLGDGKSFSKGFPSVSQSINIRIGNKGLGEVQFCVVAIEDNAMQVGHF